MKDQVEFDQSTNRLKRKYTQRKPAGSSGPIPDEDKKLMDPLKLELIRCFKILYKREWGTRGRIQATDLFNDMQAKKIVMNLEDINSSEALDNVIGGEIVPGQHQGLFNCIVTFKQDVIYQDHLKKKKEHEHAEEERKKQVKKANAARYRANARARKASGGLNSIQSSVVSDSVA
ncbi:ATP-dependent DNA helicase sgs1 [Puccinia graminis f. sp. tritici]|uniref:ATP-dependent DNA helicase sgs1 n=1 Tax=Puccinia graminis f. sp. tritici TaxID=56615 RepID=A0A5B0NS14_PUCGR|nr:ATP-dependent DNA helicase sgs1 [Puccinia graminis f. sp. tritici]KAA1075911.1 ATP-dependent DNA helicase sgs1 [Puccinia graminis f. sp. tritici]KAA1091263.1 ATP-dependent DNA helicase sgs1 [Puccinia graminis f. sp. tritici]KAA1091264.1 ATP-dependent DNA helicase sgs1 [Puccinia graminis f. sp. tritici]